MAIASAFGISGWDPIGSLGESMLNSAFTSYLGNKSAAKSLKNAKKLAQYQYDLSHQYALNAPSWNVEGLRNAGLNPILATGNPSAVNMPSMQPVSPDYQFSPSNSHGGFDNSAFQVQKLAFRQARANVDLTNSQAEATRENAASNRQNSVTNQWQIFDAKSIGAAGFNVQMFGKFGASGESKTIHTLRVNKVTGEAYDALTGQRVRVIGEVPVNSGKTVGENPPHTFNQYNYNYNNYRDYDAIKNYDWNNRSMK